MFAFNKRGKKAIFTLDPHDKSNNNLLSHLDIVKLTSFMISRYALKKLNKKKTFRTIISTFISEKIIRYSNLCKNAVQSSLYTEFLHSNNFEIKLKKE